MPSSFVHLHTHSHYSLLDGLSRIDELVGAAAHDGQPAIALTDHGALYGAVEFAKAATAAGVKPIIGVEAYYAPRGIADRSTSGEKRTNHLILLVKNETGYRNLIRLTTAAHLDGFYYKPRIDWELLDRHGDGLIVLTACLGGELSQAILHGKSGDDEKIARRFRDRFGEDYVLEVQHRPNTPEQNPVNARMLELARTLGIPVAATNDSHYLTADDAEAQDVMLCLQTKAKMGDVGRLTMRGEHYGLRTAKEMRLAFEDHPEACDTTLAIAERCTFQIEFGKIHLPSYPIPKDSTYDAELRTLCVVGLQRRYGTALAARQSEAQQRLDYELGVIRDMGYASYFLIVADFVGWAKRQGIVVGPGRGSAAGSIVAYCCDITNLDPLAYDLLFERFLAPGRIQMPDIDLDFADHRRDEVLAYVKQKYGEDHVAQIITFGTMAARAAIRDVGRVLDVPYTFCDRLAKLVPFGATLAEAEAQEPELRQLLGEDETTRRLFAIAQRLEGCARHTSTHACGVVISAQPLVEHLPIQRASAEDATIVTQYEMHAVEDLGLLKMDFLGLSNLSIIEHTVNLLRERGVAVDVEHLPLDDAPTYGLLQRAETTGIFQLESGGMKRYLKELKPSEFEDIIAMVSLYRPGPMELIPEYIDRKFGRKPVTYLQPKLEPILKNTYGIMVYQEQLMRLARDLAGFTLSEADTLRKAVGKKIKKLLGEQRNKLVRGMIANGIQEKIARSIWEWIEPFARYGFNRSHAACYALIAYQTAYLKAHYPAEFMCALLTSERGNTDRLTVLIQECHEMGITVLGPDINASGVLFSVAGTEKPAIRFGLSAIKNVGEGVVEAMVREREAHGSFRDLGELCSRVHDKDFNKKSLECIIRSGALDMFGERGMLLANLDALLAFHRDATRDAASGQSSLFSMAGVRQSLRLRDAESAPQRLVLAWEKELLGLYLSAHPFSASAEVCGSAITAITACKEAAVCDGSEIVFGGIITKTKRILTKKGEPMLFAEIEDHTASIEVVVFPRVLASSPQTWMDGTTVLVRGKRSDKDGAPKVLVDRAVQVLPGREREALDQMGMQGAHADGGDRTLLIRLPPAFPAERLVALRGLLQQFPGTVPVRLQSVHGHVVATGLRVAIAPDLRDELDRMFGAGAVQDVVGIAV